MLIAICNGPWWTHLGEDEALQDLLLERTWQKWAPQLHELQHGLRISRLPVIRDHPIQLGHDNRRAELHVGVAAGPPSSLENSVPLLLLRFQQGPPPGKFSCAQAGVFQGAPGEQELRQAGQRLCQRCCCQVIHVVLLPVSLPQPAVHLLHICNGDGSIRGLALADCLQDLVQALHLLCRGFDLRLQPGLFPAQDHSRVLLMPELAIDALDVSLCHIHQQAHVVLQLWHWGHVGRVLLLLLVQVLQVGDQPLLLAPHVDDGLLGLLQGPLSHLTQHVCYGLVVLPGGSSASVFLFPGFGLGWLEDSLQSAHCLVGGVSRAGGQSNLGGD